jgi:hypothetical protein
MTIASASAALGRAVAALTLAGLAACASDPAAAPASSGSQRLDQTPIAAPRFGTAEEEAILKVVDTFLLALGNGDRELQKSVEYPDGVLAISRFTREAAGPVRRMPSSQLQQPTPNHDPFVELYWDPVVQVRGPFAQVWAPYELRDNGAVVHCGIDAFQLVKEAGAWKIHASMSSMEPDACAALGAQSGSPRRPLDGWRETPNR